MQKNVTFQMVFVKNESGRIRVHPNPLYMLCIIIKYNLHFNIMTEHECCHFHLNKGNSSIPLFKTHKSMDKKQNRGNKLKLREPH